MNSFHAAQQTLTRRALLHRAGAAAGLGLAARLGVAPIHVGAADAMLPSPPTAVIPPSLFGMHVHRATTGTHWPRVPFKTWHFWDANVMWSDLEPQRGVYQWSELDALVALAQQHGVEPVLVLGLTPTWASARPEQVSDYGPGTSPAEPADIQ
ncbi:MAG: beta-galactosidase, partial [Thermomicrobiales bacterium]